MSKKRRLYSREFKLEALNLLGTSGKSAAQIEQDLDLTRGQLFRLKKDLKDASNESFPRHGRKACPEEEIRQLRRELEITRQERRHRASRRWLAFLPPQKERFEFVKS